MKTRVGFVGLGRAGNAKRVGGALLVSAATSAAVLLGAPRAFAQAEPETPPSDAGTATPTEPPTPSTPAQPPTSATPSAAPAPSMTPIEPQPTYAVGTPAMLPAPLANDPAPPKTEAPSSTKLTPSGYIETYYAWNFNNPSNRITNWRAFDNRHNTFTLSNAVIALNAESQHLFGRIALQAGTTGETYYGSEPAFAGSDGAAAVGVSVFKHVQEAYAGFTLPFAPRFKVDAGLFLSPIGPESMVIKDTFLWSRSNLFYGLPFYHTGARVAYAVSEDTSIRAAVYNGWNSVIDNNDEKSLSLKITSRLSRTVSFDAQYLTGAERNPGAKEGRAWRHLLDAYVTYQPIEPVTLIVNTDVGVEPNRFGTSGWASGALFARVKLQPWLFVGGRSDVFFERRAQNQNGTADAIFWPVGWLSSHAIALDARPHPNASIRLEYRHDQAEGRAFFGGKVPTVDGNFVSNARFQNTLTLGLTAWF